MISWKDTYSKYDLFGARAYILFGTYCQKFWIHITKIHLNHIHKNTIMTDEHIVSLQSNKQYLPTRLPIIILQRVEEQLPAVREVKVCAVCRQKYYIFLFWDFYGPKNKMFFWGGSYATFHFLWSEILRMISYICSVEYTL